MDSALTFHQILVIVLVSSFSSSRGQCTSTEDFAIVYDGASAFTVARNGTCSCTGKLRGDASLVTGLVNNTYVQSLVATVQQQSAIIAAQSMTIASLNTTIANLSVSVDLLLSHLVRKIGQFGSTRYWTDGTYANSCQQYIASGSDKFSYSGTTGNGIYRIYVLGVPTDVYCDMTSSGGGWTLAVAIIANSIFHLDQVAAVGNVQAVTVAGKLSDAAINSLNTVGYWRYICNGNAINIKNTVNTWTSMRVNSYTWYADLFSGTAFATTASRSGYVFSTFPASPHTNYAASSGAAEGNGCYWGAWNCAGSLWVK